MKLQSNNLSNESESEKTDDEENSIIKKTKERQDYIVLHLKPTK